MPAGPKLEPPLPAVRPGSNHPRSKSIGGAGALQHADPVSTKEPALMPNGNSTTRPSRALHEGGVSR